MSEDALRKTWEHIDLVIRLLTSAQIELMRRAVTHDRSKLASPEWEMFAEITNKLEGLTYGSLEYEAQRKEMLGQALGHHYEHNRHHPEFFEPAQQDEALATAITNLEEVDAFFGHYPNIGWGEGVDAIQYAIAALKQQQAQQVSGVSQMNLFDLLEMLIDWQCACKRHADGDVNKSIEINRDRFSMSPQLVQIFKNTVPWIEDKFEGLNTQKDLSI
jgi:Family of unknown function (DUF5662)